MADRIGVPLELSGFEVMSSEVVNGFLEVHVRSTRKPGCHHCGSVAVIGHGRNERRIRDRSCAHPTVLRWSQRRLRCTDCGRTSRERHPEIAGRRSITNRFRHRLFEQAVAQPFAHVASLQGVSQYRVLDAFDAHAEAELADEPPPPRVLSVDESAFRRRFHYHSVVSDPEHPRVLDMFEGRTRQDAVRGLQALSAEVRAGVETVVIDMHWPYRQAIEEVLPEARVVADKFHVLRSIFEAAQKIRRRFGRRPAYRRIGREGGTARQHLPASDPELFRARWVFMKRAGNLTEAETEWLESVFDRMEPEVRAAWLMKEAFASIYDAGDRVEAERRLEVWVHNLEQAKLAEFTNAWRTLHWWREQILAYFDDPVTNGFAEGITNKIKVMKRSAYGFRSAERYRRKVLLSTGHRRTPAGPTHRFSG